MVEWHFQFSREGEEDLKNLDAAVRERIVKKLKWFKDNFSLLIPETLGGEWKNYFKLRIGDWRVVYEINYSSRLAVIHRIELRDKVYKKRK